MFRREKRLFLIGIGLMYLSILFTSFTNCYMEVYDPPGPNPYPVPTPDYYYEEPYCGDFWCDSDWGENEWWCSDCGYDPYIGGPSDLGWCGDHHCFGYENEYNCWQDCKPEPYNSDYENTVPFVDPPDPMPYQ